LCWLTSWRASSPRRWCAASVRTLEEVTLRFAGCGADRPDWPVTFSLAHLTAGLAGLPRLRALSLAVEDVCMEATLPASVSRLAQLTSLSLRGFDNLCCEPGWARLPALECLESEDCMFGSSDGEAALPGVDALAALTSFGSWSCSGLRVLPASLWGLTQLCELAHCGGAREVADVPRDVLPFACVPAGGAHCFASLTYLVLAGSTLPVFPPGVLAATRLTHLELSHCCFAQLPQGVSVLTGLKELRLERHSAVAMEVGGALDARALGSLARFPHLSCLIFGNCSVLICPEFPAAAAHPCLEHLVLRTAYPDSGPSCVAFLGFVHALLRRGRARALCLVDSLVRGAGRRNSRNFRAALEAVGYPLSDADLVDLL